MEQAFRSAGFAPSTAHQQALSVIDRGINLQASVMSFGDIFHVVGWSFVGCLPLLFLLQKPQNSAAPVDAH